jgi:hypothetical protein
MSSNEEKPIHRAPASVKRKLAAILAADVKGYSRLMGEDEVATLYTLTAYRQVTDALIRKHLPDNPLTVSAGKTTAEVIRTASPVSP